MHKSKKIIIVSAYFSANGGGVQKYAYQLALHLKTYYNWKIVYIAAGAENAADQKFNFSGITVYKLGSQFVLSNTPFSFEWSDKIKKIFREEKPDLINIHMPVPGIGDIAALTSCDIPYVLTYHGDSLKKGNFFTDIPIKIYENTVLKKVFKKAVKIVASSDYLRSGFLNNYKEKTATVTPGVDINTYKPANLEQKKKASILFVAGLTSGERYKGLPALFNIIKNLENEIPDISLTVVGDGNLRGYYMRLAKKMEINHRVNFTGRLKGTNLQAAYQKSSCVVSLSTKESFGMSLLEGMSTGLPLIAYSVGGIPSLIENGKNGYLVKSGDEAKISEKLKLILKDQVLAKKLGDFGRKKAERKFDWLSKAETYNQIFTNVLQTPKSLSVVHVVGYYPPHIGGMEQRVKELATFQAATGIKTTVLTSNIGTPSGTFFQDKVKVIYFKGPEIAHTPILPGLVKYLLTAKGIDLIHLHVAQAFFPETVALIAKLRHKKYIAHVRCLIMPSGKFGFILPFYNKFILSWVYRNAEKVIVLTPDYKNILKKDYKVPADKIIVIPNATTFKTAARSRLILHSPVRFLAVGRVGIQKNYPLMLKVMEKLKNDYKIDFELKIAGPGEAIKELTSQVSALSLEHNVRFLGAVERTKIEKLYEDSDIMIHSSLVEGFSTVLLEAMSKGMPIVASNVTGTKGVIRDGVNGLLSELSVDDMSRKIYKLIDKTTLYRQISKNNLLEVQKYKWENILKQTLKVYGINI